jgi:uncharacterized protein YwqG
MLSDQVRERLESACERRGVRHAAGAIAALARPAVRLRLSRAEEDSFAIGATRFGGSPDLPAGFAWPMREGRPLTFIGQVECAPVRELIEPASRPEAELLPRDGLLSFFYDALAQPWGLEIAHRGSSAIVYSPSDVQLRRVARPQHEPPEDADLYGPAELNACAARLEAVLTWPGWETLAVEGLGIEGFVYSDIMCEAEPPLRGAQHQLLGWPRELQGEMQTECAERWAGLGPSAIDDPFTGEQTAPEPADIAARREAARAEAERWRLLLQVDSQEALGSEWGDVGRVYFWVHERSLRDRSFEQRWAVLQCT